MVFETFSVIPVSVQQTPLFCNDLKLCLAIVDSLRDLYSNVSLLQDTSECCYQIKTWLKPASSSDPMSMLLLARRFQSLRSSMISLYVTLTMGTKEIDDSLKVLSVGLAGNRNTTVNSFDIYNKCIALTNAFKTEANSKSYGNYNL